MDTVPSQLRQEAVSSLRLWKIDRAECSSAPDPGDEPREPVLELLQPTQHHGAGLSNPTKKVVLNDRLHNLEGVQG